MTNIDQPAGSPATENDEETDADKLVNEALESGELRDDQEDAYRAYIELVGDHYANVGDFEEAYQGEYRSDEDFAQETAESIGAIDTDASWPNDCIDWERAARELMYDYAEENGYYFRNI